MRCAAAVAARHQPTGYLGLPPSLVGPVIRLDGDVLHVPETYCGINRPGWHKPTKGPEQEAGTRVGQTAVGATLLACTLQLHTRLYSAASAIKDAAAAMLT